MERTYVLEPGAYLRKAGDHLAVTKAGALIAEIPLEGLRQLTLVGAASLSAVWREMVAAKPAPILVHEHTPFGAQNAQLVVHVSIEGTVVIGLEVEVLATQTWADSLIQQEEELLDVYRLE